MTNAEWIRGMTDAELAKNFINPCDNFECGECPMNNGNGRCVANSSEGIAMEWLESERGKGR